MAYFGLDPTAPSFPGGLVVGGADDAGDPRAPTRLKEIVQVIICVCVYVCDCVFWGEGITYIYIPIFSSLSLATTMHTCNDEMKSRNATP